MLISSLPTPVVLIDRARLLNNIRYAQRLADTAGMRLRPHAKTHKSPVIARWQVEHGAVGICCAKLGEAEVFADSGIDDIRLPYPVQPSNAARVLALMDRIRLSIIVDNLDVAQGWSDAVRRAGRALDVLVKVDVGFHRCGIDPDAPGALAFIQQVSAMPGLRLRGLLSHAGHSYGATTQQELADIARQEAAILFELRDAAARSGLELPELSVGATPTLRFSAAQAGLTELRPGNYVYYDRSQAALGSASLADCSIAVLTTVVSKPAADRIILDAGSKTLSSDTARGYPLPPGYGGILGTNGQLDDRLTIERLSEEHATVRVEGTTSLEPGDRVRVLPNHSCLVANMVDEVQLVDGEMVLETLRVAARGKIA